MKTLIFSAIAAIALAAGAAGLAHAQVPPPQAAAQPYPQGYPQSYPQGCPPRVTPSAQELDQRYMRRFGSLGLSPAQQQRIQSMVAAFSQTHPAGSPLDPSAMHQLRDAVRSVLTPQQIGMLEQMNQGHGGGYRRCP